MRFRENFFGFLEEVVREEEEEDEVVGLGVGLASPLFWVEVELVAMVAREEGILEVLLWTLLSGEMRMRGVEKRGLVAGERVKKWE